MRKQDICVLMLTNKASPQFTDDLLKGGFADVVNAADQTPREAIKTAIASGMQGIITVDPDQGYTVQDIEKVAKDLIASPDKLCIGEPQEPEKKNLAENIYAMLTGVSSASALTSLFGMSAKTAQTLAGMKSAEDTFLRNLPLEARIDNIDTVDVATSVAIPAPGFELLTKSFKVYYVFLKFSIAAFLAYLVDIGTFWLFEIWFGFLDDEYKILVATVLSRILCSIATYVLNRGAVFKSHANQGGAIVRFLILAAGQLVASWLLVWGLGSLLGGGDVTNMLLKVVVDFVIFMASFTIQRDWVFKKTPGLLK